MRGPLSAPIAALLAIGCGASTPPVEEPSEPEPTVIAGPLAALLPGGALSVVIARPDELAEEPAVRIWSELVLTDEALERIEVRTGIHPSELSELVRADYGEGRVVWLVRGAGDPEALVRAAEMRMNTVAERGEEPLRRTGFIGTRRRTWAALADDSLLVAGGHLEAEVAAILDAAARARQPGRSIVGAPEDLDWAVDGLPQPTTGGYLLANTMALYQAHRQSPFLLLMPSPLDLPRDTGVGMLLARQDQLAATIEPEGELLKLGVTLTGEFPPGAQSNFEQLFVSIAGSDLGHVLGLTDARESFSIDVVDETIQAEVRWPASGLARGVELLGTDDPWALIEGG